MFEQAIQEVKRWAEIIMHTAEDILRTQPEKKENVDQ